MSSKDYPRLPNQLIARYPPELLSEFERALDDGDVPEEIAFDPVPRLRKRRGGWSEEKQRAFIAALQLLGSVAAAARSVGLTPRGAYRLLECDGADSFAIAWDKAVEEGLERTRTVSLERALHGALVPVLRRGKLVRWEHRRCDRLAIALLGNRSTAIDWYRQGALRRHVYKMELKADDERKAEEKKRNEEAARAYQEELERMIERGRQARQARMPRITRL
jgi:hypothetical protein